MRWRWLVLLVPLAIGLLLAVLLNSGSLPNPVVRILISVSTIFLLLGILMSGFLAAAWAIWTLSERTRIRQLDELRAKTSDDRRRFLRRLDHELKNPLMAMRAGLANFANAPTAATRQSALSTVEAQTVRLSRLTSDLRKIAELENRPLERSPIDLQQLMREAMELAREKPEADRRRIGLNLPKAPWPLPMISGDWDLIFLAVYNLLDNALKFTQAGDTIEIRGREDGRYVVLEVADTGPGIKSGDLPHVWEELYRGEAGRTVPGSGLGMALVRAIVERHGGTVSLDSKAGHGTVVSLRLPIAAPLND